MLSSSQEMLKTRHHHLISSTRDQHHHSSEALCIKTTLAVRQSLSECLFFFRPSFRRVDEKTFYHHEQIDDGHRNLQRNSAARPDGSIGGAVCVQTSEAGWIRPGRAGVTRMTDGSHPAVTASSTCSARPPSFPPTLHPFCFNECLQSLIDSM